MVWFKIPLNSLIDVLIKFIGDDRWISRNMLVE